ncbi:MAG TPA: ComEC/Rec2 family competence protein, partial [Anaerolineaceae bacterium]|nr:ComEC/Rec2 family competence protein [Anaerolineaceae bacterium]
RLSVIGLLANILIVPIQSYVMVWGWLAVLVGLVWEPLGELAAWVAWLPLTYTLEVVRKMGRWDWASISFTLSSTYAWIFYGGLLIVALLRFQHPDDRAALFRRLQQRAVVVGLLAGGAMVAVLVWVAALNQPDGRLHVWFLDVGHGHAVLIQTPQGSQILVDGGPNPSQIRQAVGDALPFWDNALDVVIMTQAEDAAIGGLPALLERYSVKLALTNGQRSDILEAAWKNQKTRVLPVTAGYQLQTQDGVRIEVLSPQTMPNSEDDSKLVSMVLRLSYGDTSFLITPNMDVEAEEALIQAGWYVGSTVLELPAYGRDEENSADFLDKVGPQVAVVSVGAGNRANLPDSVVAERLQAPLYRTDQQGTIEIVTDGKKLWVYTHD